MIKLLHVRARAVPVALRFLRKYEPAVQATTNGIIRPALTTRTLPRPSPLRRHARSAAPATTALFAALGENTTLTYLALRSGLGLPLSAVAALALALRHNATLRELRLLDTALWAAAAHEEADGPAAASAHQGLLLAAVGDGPQGGSLCALDGLHCPECFRLAGCAEACAVVRAGLRGAALRLRELDLSYCHLDDAGALLLVYSCCCACSSLLCLRCEASRAENRPLVTLGRDQQRPRSSSSFLPLAPPPALSSGAEAIAEGLRDPACRLERLELQRNRIADSGGACLCV